MRLCPKCQAPVKEGDKFCDHCGTRLPQVDENHDRSSNHEVNFVMEPNQLWATGVCASCGKEYILGEMFCEHCGVQIPPTISISKSSVSKSEHVGSVVSKRPQVVGLERICSYCGKQNEPEAEYCDNCGTLLLDVVDAKTSQSKETIRLEENSPMMSVEMVKLILFGTDTELILKPKSSRILVGRTDTTRDIFPDIDLVPYEGKKLGVSRQHAEIIFQDEHWLIQDLNSTNYTFLNDHKLLPGRTYLLSSGDMIRFGMMVFTFQVT